MGKQARIKRERRLARKLQRQRQHDARKPAQAGRPRVVAHQTTHHRSPELAWSVTVIDTPGGPISEDSLNAIYDDCPICRRIRAGQEDDDPFAHDNVAWDS